MTPPPPPSRAFDPVHPRPFVLAYLAATALLLLGAVPAGPRDRLPALGYAACALLFAWLFLPALYPAVWEHHRPCGCLRWERQRPRRRFAMPCDDDGDHDDEELGRFAD